MDFTFILFILVISGFSWRRPHTNGKANGHLSKLSEWVLVLYDDSILVAFTVSLCEELKNQHLDVMILGTIVSSERNVKNINVKLTK